MSTINVNVKSSSDKKFVIAIETSKTVLDLKNAIAEQTEVAAERQRLIYSGRVLKDHDTLADYKIADGNTVHMVKSSGGAGASGPARGMLLLSLFYAFLLCLLQPMRVYQKEREIFGIKKKIYIQAPPQLLPQLQQHLLQLHLHLHHNLLIQHNSNSNHKQQVIPLQL